MALPSLERKQYKLGKYDIVAQPLLGSAHMLRYTVMLNGKRIGALMSVPSESDCRFMEAPPPVPPLRIFALTNRPGRPKKGTTPTLALRGAVGLFRRRDFLKAAALAWPASALPQAAKKDKPPPGILVNDVHSQLNSTRVWRIVQPDTLDGVRSAIRAAQKEQKQVCLSGARHAMGGQQFLADGLMIDTRRLSKVLAFDAEKGHIEVEAGMQWPQLLQALTSTPKRPRAAVDLRAEADRRRQAHHRRLPRRQHPRPRPEDAALHRRRRVVQAAHRQGRRGGMQPHATTRELFRLAIGGYGLFGMITSATLRLVERRKVERVVEVRSIDGLPKAFAERIRDGYLYGDFQYAIDETSGDFLNRGVFSCYKPVDPDNPGPANQRELRESDWTELLHLAHHAKGEAFRRYAGFYLQTNGQVYWADEAQMSVYPENYHRALDQRLGSQVKATEAITEIYCERERSSASWPRCATTRGATRSTSSTARCA